MSTLTLHAAELRVTSAGAGPPLVLLHGLGGSGEDWAPQVAAFSGRYRVIVPDARGSGRSRGLVEPHGPFTIPQLARDLAAVLDRLGAGPAHLVGWSMGGMIALQLAVDAPGRVASLVIVNSGPDWTPKTPLQRLALRSRGLVTGVLGPGAMARVLAPRLFPRPDQAGLRRDHVARMGRNDARSYAALLDAIMGWSVADRLASLTMPTLVVASEGDYTSVASKAAWARQLPDGRLLVVPGARHALPLEAPEAFNALLAAFLEEVQPPDGR